MPYSICPKCGENVCHPTVGDWLCQCMTKDGAELYGLRGKQVRDLELLKSDPNTDCPVISAIEHTLDKYATWQSVKELYWIYDHLKRTAPSVIVEIGCYNGGTLDLWERFARLGGLDALLVGIDLVTERIDVRLEIRHKVTLYKVDSSTAEAGRKLDEYLQGGKIDFAFIDGQHLYEYVQRDFSLLWPRMRTGGAIGFHDINWSPGQVGKFWDELTGEKYETRQAFGIGVIYKD